MLGIGMQEILIILVVALIVIGPKKLPELARTLGKGFAEFKKAADDLQNTVRMDLERDKHEQFREKYPNLVPEEDEEQAEGSRQEGEVSTDKAAPAENGQDKTVTTTAEVTPEPAPEVETEPEISYNPEEIEGGDEMTGETGDDTPDEPRNV